MLWMGLEGLEEGQNPAQREGLVVVPVEATVGVPLVEEGLSEEVGMERILEMAAMVG